MQHTNPIEQLKSRMLPDGGFCEKSGGDYRPEATAWAVIALRASGNGKEPMFASAMAQLANSQAPDGRIAIDPGYSEAYWPTPLSILAWQGIPEYVAHARRANQFLVQKQGHHWPSDPDEEGHDPAIPGWPWIDATHSWVEPTAMALLALRAGDLGDHPRAESAVKLLMDRQLSNGGWNYGNTVVFGKDLRPMPEMTGMALQALSGLVPTSSVADGLNYLERELPYLNTPLSLGWAILGLSAWHRRPETAEEKIQECLSRQSKYGRYGTTLLSVLLISYHARNGLLGIYRS